MLGKKHTEDFEGKYDIEKMTFSGFIAQEVDAAAGKLGYDFSGVDKAGPVWGIRYAEFVPSIVKAIQEQQQMIDANTQQNELLKQQVEELKKQNQLLMKIVEDLKK